MTISSHHNRLESLNQNYQNEVRIRWNIPLFHAHYLPSSKISVSSVRGQVKEILAEANGEKKRNFVETIELQIGLKNYDPQRDKRFSGTVKWVFETALRPTLTIPHRLPNVPRPRMSICILADAADIDRAKQIELEYMSVDDLKK